MRKFRPGPKIKTMAKLSREIEKGHYVYLNVKAQHPGWLQSMTWRTLNAYVASGRARVELINNNEGNKNAAAN